MATSATFSGYVLTPSLFIPVSVHYLAQLYTKTKYVPKVVIMKSELTIRLAPLPSEFNVSSV